VEEAKGTESADLGGFYKHFPLPQTPRKGENIYESNSNFEWVAKREKEVEKLPTIASG
jgi:hypothetical protein